MIDQPPSPVREPLGGTGPERIRWWKLRWADWRHVARTTAGQISGHNVPIVSAGVAFYSVLAVIPMAIMAVTIYGLVTEPGEAERQIQRLLEVVPGDTASLLADQMRPIASSPGNLLGIGFAASAVGLLWTASSATRSTVRAIAIAYDEDPRSSRFGTRLASLWLTLAVLVFFAAVLGLVAILPAWLASTGIPAAVSGSRWILLFLLVTSGALLLYRYAPPREAPPWGSLLPGAVLAGVMWVFTTVGFAFYVANFGSYNQTYGVLGGAVILMVWFLLSALSILVGAEFSAALERNQRHSLTPPI
ncbi:MAG TPA: YihY/virulence factor BrkB family protein [Acidimicrobiia bacterium]|nr:YihY/virulence factor BrkB family protein [Acidimicrobiia bacterium]